MYICINIYPIVTVLYNTLRKITEVKKKSHPTQALNYKKGTQRKKSHYQITL